MKTVTDAFTLGSGFGIVFLAIGLVPPPVAHAQSELPFFSGEELTYRVRVGVLGTVGTGTMRVEGPVRMRGTDVLVLRSEMRSSVPFVRGVDRTESWLDPREMRVLRFEKYERNPLANQEEVVEVFAEERRWVSAAGATGTIATAAPLDELSFIYFLRTLELAPGAAHTFDRHFDSGRNPVAIRVLGREMVRVGAGDFASIVVEMRVRDPGRYLGEGVIRISFSDTPCRIPLRIESGIPAMGRTVLTLESHTHPDAHFARVTD
jgi:hypothetical protein